MPSLPVYFGAKKAGRAERERKGLAPEPNGRSADFVVAGFAAGRHRAKLPSKVPGRVAPRFWVYDIGENTDRLTPAARPLTRRTLGDFLAETGAGPSFATKAAGDDLLPERPAGHRGRVRARGSLMPPAVAAVVEAGTSPVAARIDAADA